MIDQRVLDKFQTNIKFKEICVESLSRFYPWKKEQVISFKDKLYFNRMSLMANKSIHWESDLFHEVEDKLDWDAIWKLNGLEIGLDFFAEFKDKIDFSSIYLHQNLDWSNQLLDTYEDYWNWDGLMMRPIMANPRNIKKFESKYNWDKFSSNRYLKLSNELIDTYRDKWNWSKLSQNINFTLDKIGIEKYRGHVCFKALSRNPSMIPYILAFPNEYSWDWSSFTQNPSLVLGEKLIDFLIAKFKISNNHFQVSDDLKEKWAQVRIIKLYALSGYADLDVIRNSKLGDNIPYGELIKIKPEFLSEEELVEHWNFEHCKNIIQYQVMQKFPLAYIESNLYQFLNFHTSLFRHGDISEKFIGEHIQNDDWFNLAFNENYEWTIDFLIENVDKFEASYGLSQNSKVFDLLFSEAEKTEIDALLQSY